MLSPGDPREASQAGVLQANTHLTRKEEQILRKTEWYNIWAGLCYGLMSAEQEGLKRGNVEVKILLS